MSRDEPSTKDAPSAITGRVALVSVFAATLLVALKLGTGLATNSLGLVSAGIESSGDVVAALLTLLALRLARRPADESHPYGHRRAENLAALGEAAILGAGGIVVVVEAVGRLAGRGVAPDDRWYVFAAIGVALTIDVTRVLASVRSAVRYKSAALRSNAFHFGGDMAGSIAVLGGLLAVRAGFHDGDVIAALVVATIIFSATGRLIFENARVLMDTMPVEGHARALEAIGQLGEDIELRRLRVRESGGQYFADAVVAVPPGQPVVESEDTAAQVESAVREAFPDSDVVVHLEPRREGLGLRDQALAAALSEPVIRDVHDIAIYSHDGRRSVSVHLKMSPDLSLADAHDAAERVEAALRAQPGVEDVRTHIEPLERPRPAHDDPGDSDETERERITALVLKHTGLPPRDLRMLQTEGGAVVFVSITVGGSTGLTEAHQLASVLEEDIRAGHPKIADVVVHTEP